MLALTGQARRWEPKRLRLRLFSAAARLVTTGRRRILRLARHWPWTDVITTAFSRPAGPAESRLSSNNNPPRRAADSLRNRGTRRTPDATAGPSAYPPTTRTSRNGPPNTSTDRHEKSEASTPV